MAASSNLAFVDAAASPSGRWHVYVDSTLVGLDIPTDCESRARANAHICEISILNLFSFATATALLAVDQLM